MGVARIFVSFVTITHQTLLTCEISAQYIERFKSCGGGRTDQPTDRQTDRWTLQNIGILANPKIQFFAYFGLQSGPPFARDGSPIKLIINSALIPN